ncbi:hemoglobin subunit alpha-like [Nelusetta ayraudi]|uniref:hemoglobin subunit alpha-like n=1 Tax=Nelusetta ayraudi TaxID=303726 RepID=UPI003F704EA1
MSLTEKDKAVVKAFWAKVSKSQDAIGAEAMGRMITVYPQTKTYFSHWPDLAVGSTSVNNHGSKVISGVALAVKCIDDLATGLLDLSEQHAYSMRVDPANFKILCHCILVAVSIMFPKDFSPEVHVAFDKFLCAVSLSLSERYR